VGDVRAFYDDLAPLYHLIYEDWEAASARHGRALAALITERWGPGARVVLDAAVGIGTQALGLLGQGFDVIGSDLSLRAVARAAREASARGLRLRCLVADFRAAALRPESADVVLAADNALPHLESTDAIATALGECFSCVRAGGGCVITMRDYGTPPPAGTVERRPYGERSWQGRRYRLQQVWTWHGPRYEVAMEIVLLDAGATERATILKTSYLAIAPARVAELMHEVGFEDVEQLDGRFFQPVLVGTRPRRS
jgi:SAM-dependent methyltransferase